MVPIKGVAVGVFVLVGAYAMARAIAHDASAVLGWLALVPLFVVIRRCRAGGAMLAGGLWGLAVWVFTWGAGEAVGRDLLSVSLLTTVPAVYACLGAGLTRRIGFSPFVLGVGWMGVELAVHPAGLRLGLLAAGTQSDVGLLQWVAHALGYALVAFAVAYVNALVLEVLAPVLIGVPRSLPYVECGDHHQPMRPQTSVFVPRFAPGPLQPRAPPWLADLSYVQSVAFDRSSGAVRLLA